MTRFPNRPAPDAVADVGFLTTREGGRQNPVRSGYRCSHDMGVLANGQAILNDAEHVFDGEGLAVLGATRRSRMRFLALEYQFGRLHAGLVFTLCEGAKIVGHGTIVEIIDARLRSADGDPN